MQHELPIVWRALLEYFLAKKKILEVIRDKVCYIKPLLIRGAFFGEHMGITENPDLGFTLVVSWRQSTRISFSFYTSYVIPATSGHCRRACLTLKYAV